MKPERIQEPLTLDLPGWRFEQKDQLCRSFELEQPSDALDLVIHLCRLAKQHEQNPSFRVREGHVYVQLPIPAESSDEGLLQLAKELNDLYSRTT